MRWHDHFQSGFSHQPQAPSPPGSREPHATLPSHLPRSHPPAAQLLHPACEEAVRPVYSAWCTDQTRPMSWLSRLCYETVEMKRKHRNHGGNLTLTGTRGSSPAQGSPASGVGPCGVSCERVVCSAHTCPRRLHRTSNESSLRPEPALTGGHTSEGQQHLLSERGRAKEVDHREGHRCLLRAVCSE